MFRNTQKCIVIFLQIVFCRHRKLLQIGDSFDCIYINILVPKKRFVIRRIDIHVLQSLLKQLLLEFVDFFFRCFFYCWECHLFGIVQILDSWIIRNRTIKKSNYLSLRFTFFNCFSTSFRSGNVVISFVKAFSKFSVALA